MQPSTMPVADPYRRLRRVFDVVIVLLVPAVLAFAYSTLHRPMVTPAVATDRAATPGTPTPATPTTSTALDRVAPLPLTGGAAWLGADGTTVVAVTAGDCVAGATTPGRMLRRPAGDPGFNPYSNIPLTEVTSIDVLQQSIVYATGLDAQCHKVHVVTTDGGARWVRAAGFERLAAVDHVDTRTAWAITAGDDAQVVRTRDGGRTFTPVSYPCPSDLASPRLVTAFVDDIAWVVCAGSSLRGLQARLVYGTSDGGRTWTELSGARRGAPRNGRPDGLDGDGDLREIGFSSRNDGWATVITPSCGVGELRITRDGGRNWTRRPCPTAAGATMDRSFAVSFRDAAHGFVIGVRDGSEVGFDTADGGRTWHRVTSS